MEKEISLKKVFTLIKNRIWILLLFGLLAAVAGGLYSHYTYVPIYQSSTHSLVKADDKMFSNLTAMIKQPFLLEKVITKMNYEGSEAGLGSKISISQSGQMLILSVIDTNPERAAVIANTVTEVFIEESSNKENYDFHDITFYTPAEVSPWPINPESNKLAIIGFILGVGLAIGLIFLMDSLDDSTKGTRDTEKLLGIPVLGRVSKMTKRSTNMKAKKQKSYSMRGESIGS
ncbi:YveK family protein [Litchfieldia alkalitelluris]|uniref:YveK family protein n=1 Tax=Litchfieldia alkalitelluris TaxID=304268 RepID=UPI00147408AC|nr:Wzz/FepE/Etk N-terminal domain-containing protein [Litchfieldia alkalitelluris]